ncbi:hypothetical protein, partial [Aliivibrio sp. 1S128]|uniref:hypothetical protein n=1 Tax=Aliivibrio sp. 1S128 TaxID=1840085 RepID=UPI00080E3CCF
MSACSTSPSHVGSVNKDKSGDEFSIKENGSSFVVAGHYSEYQFVRNSQDGFIGCTNLLNKAAKEYASNNELTINYPTWNEVTIIDHGRDILTAVMNVNCQFEYKDINQIVTDLDITGELKDLSA